MMVSNLSNTHFSVTDLNGNIRVFNKTQVKDLYLESNKITIIVNSVNNQEKVAYNIDWNLTDVFNYLTNSYIIHNTNSLTSDTQTLVAIYNILFPSPLPTPTLGTETIIIACSDETSDLIVINSAVQFNMPYDGQIFNIKANVNGAPDGDDIVIDILKNGVSILSSPLTIDDGDTTSLVSSNPVVINTTNFLNDDVFNVEILNIGSVDAGYGLKLTMIIGQ